MNSANAWWAIRRRSWLALTVCALSYGGVSYAQSDVLAPEAPNGVTESVLHSFDGTDGANPVAGLLREDGGFYGTTSGGGASNDGTVYRITSRGTLTTLHSFSGPDGATPDAGLVQGRDGNFYGTTLNGGAYDDGTVFTLSVHPDPPQ